MSDSVAEEFISINDLKIETPEQWSDSVLQEMWEFVNSLPDAEK